jgi:hypothetical protein
MAGIPSTSRRADQDLGGQTARGSADGVEEPGGWRSSDSRIFRIGYSLVTVNLWLRTAILAGVAVALIGLSFQWHVMTRPTITSFLASQLGTGILVGALGAALVQAVVMSAPQTIRELVEELRTRPREAELGDRLAELTAELRKHDLRTSSSDALSRMGVVDVLTSSDEGAAKMSAVLDDPELSDVRLLGVSLSTWFGGRRHSRGLGWPGERLEHLLLDGEPGIQRPHGIHVRVMLVDPSCLGLRLLTHGPEGDSLEELGRLRNEIDEVAGHLSALSRKVARQASGNSLQVRFYRGVPPFFLLTARQGAFTRSYYHGLAGDARSAASEAVWHFGAESAAYQASGRHFDAIWDTDSVPCEESLTHKAIGTDQGIGESGIVNIYTDRESAQERIRWLISHARQRVWIQGVSLSHHLSPPLEEVMLGLLQNEAVDTRVLILDADSDQAVRKSYRDYLLDQNDGAAIDYETYVKDKHLHTTSQFYGNLRHSTRRLETMRARTPAGNFQVRQYACAPTSYILVADDHALIEQFHYGKPVNAAGSMKAQLQLAREMPLIEYARPGSDLFEAQPWLNPLSVIEDHFSQVFERFGSPVQPSS